jgi:hypothetical protein
MTAIFVTSTGTDIGKTFVTAGLIRHLRGSGRTVEALKPVVTGFDPAMAANSDPGVLLTAMDRPAELEEIARSRHGATAPRFLPISQRAWKARRSTSPGSASSPCAPSSPAATCCSSKASAASWRRSTTSTPCSTG